MLHIEQTIESSIVESLVQHGNYSQGNAPDYSPELGMFRYDLAMGNKILSIMKRT